MKKAALYLMGVLYIIAGINHFVNPETYLRIMPPWVPAHQQLVAASGVAEILLGALLFPPASRKMAAWGIIILLVAVFPANVQMLLNYAKEDHPMLWLSVIRLPLQVGLIYWAWLYTKHPDL